MAQIYSLRVLVHSTVGNSVVFSAFRVQQEMTANRDPPVPLVPEEQLVQWAFQDQKASLSVGAKAFIFF